ncbi:hypothetical protein TNCV_2450671 [Trichonephila clavipes]|nr:hypothetical protein TNCV_2450671 [Trichonephila clavipes]
MISELAPALPITIQELKRGVTGRSVTKSPQAAEQCDVNIHSLPITTPRPRKDIELRRSERESTPQHEESSEALGIEFPSPHQRIPDYDHYATAVSEKKL